MMGRDLNGALFAKSSIFDLLEHRKRQALEAIGTLSANQVMEASDERLLEHFTQKFDLDPLTLYLDRSEKRVEETTVETRDSFRYDIPRGSSLNIPGVRLAIRIPFSGDSGLWEITPSMYSMNPPRGDISSPGRDGIGYLTLVVSSSQHQADAATLETELNAKLLSVQNLIGNQRANIEQFRAELRRLVADALRDRRSRAEQMFGLAQKLNLALNQKDGTPVLAPIKVERRLIVQLPSSATAQYKAQPGIANESYELILNAIRSQGRTFERAPGTFCKFGEEELRDVILANLNTHFVDRATGETFCRRGKTDIHITEEGRAAFIGECKVWSGEKELQRGLQQLLSYLTWRHCKTALIVFNKDRAKFIELLEKAAAALRSADKLFLQNISSDSAQGEWRMLFRSPEDDGHEVTVHLFLFNLYVESAEEDKP